MNDLLTWDLKLFFYINGRWTNGFFDFLLPWMREPYVWAPLYLFLLVFVPIKLPTGRAFSGSCSSSSPSPLQTSPACSFKNLVGRLRPGNDPVIAPYVRVLVEYYPRSGSFYILSCRQPFRAGDVFFYNFKTADREMGLAVLRMGRGDMLFPDICRRALPARHCGGRFTGNAGGHDERRIFSTKNKTGTGTDNMNLTYLILILAATIGGGMIPMLFQKDASRPAYLPAGIYGRIPVRRSLLCTFSRKCTRSWTTPRAFISY